MRIAHRQIIVVISLILAACCLLGVIVYGAVLLVEANERRIAYEREIEPFLIERAELNWKYTHAEDIVRGDNEKIPNSNITLLFLGVEKEIYTQVYPLMDEISKEVKGTLCLTVDAMPGDEGCITLEELDTLIINGWSLALLFEGSGEEELRAFLSAIRQRLAELEIEVPATLACKKGSYSPSLDSLIIEEGFAHVIHNAEEQTACIDKTVDGELFHPGAVGWRAERMQRFFMDELMTFGGCASFTIDLNSDRLDDKLDMSNNALVTSFTSMIEAIDGWVQDDLCTAKDVGFGLNLRKMYLEYYALVGEEVKELRAQIEVQLKELEREIALVQKKYR